MLWQLKVKRMLNLLRHNFAGMFTLVELLTVVAIVVILASLLLPALANVRKKSLQIECLNNMRQLGICFNMYAQDFNNYIPANYDSVKTWGETLKDCAYFENKNFLVCPSWLPNEFVSYGSTYGYRCYWGENTSIQYFMRINELGRTFNTPLNDYFMLTDSIGGTTGKQWYYVVMGDSGSIRQIHLRHSKKANTLFPDGHAGLSGTSYFQGQGTGVWSFQY
jgi:prepilin-type processing-associated H-X9-DG protein